MGRVNTHHVSCTIGPGIYAWVKQEQQETGKSLAEILKLALYERYAEKINRRKEELSKGAKEVRLP